ncbi:hypothetical protein KR044_002367 [Drosophila immigrans]|nr:hypothetical protein KR044_002367 [Drosophila immigrans]
MHDLSSCCRVCLEEPHRAQMLDMNEIYDKEAQLTYYDCYEICTKENLSECGEHDPNSLCKHCGVELQWAYDFHKKVTLAREQLKNMRNHLDSADEDVEQQLEQELTVAKEEAASETVIDTETVEIPVIESSDLKSSAFVSDISPRQRLAGKYSCNICNKPFQNHCHMQKHQLIHLSDRPQFECSACHRIYLTKQALKVHVDAKHNNAGSKCNTCGKVFAIAKGLEIHMRYHKGHFPFPCDQCDRKFAQRSHLNVHLQVQHCSARFICEFSNCGKLFTSSSALHNHECTHTEMPFECNVCQQGFPARYKLVVIFVFICSYFNLPSLLHCRLRLHAQRKHNMQLTLEQLETMRKFHIMRSKRILAKIETQQQENPATNEES